MFWCLNLGMRAARRQSEAPVASSPLWVTQVRTSASMRCFQTRRYYRGEEGAGIYPESLKPNE